MRCNGAPCEAIPNFTDALIAGIPQTRRLLTTQRATTDAMPAFQTLLTTLCLMLFARSKGYPSLQQAVKRRLNIWTDERAGLDFLRVTQPRELGFDENVVHRGSPSGNKYLSHLLIDLDIQHHDAVLDIGCAKGSAMRTMLDFPFARVDGVEISAQLAAIASANFERLGKRNAQVFNANAVDFDAYGRYNVFYFYNPFPDEVMRQVMAQLRRQLDPDREALIIYNTPKCHGIVVEHGFTPMRDYPDQWGNGIRVYSNRPADSRLLARPRA